MPRREVDEWFWQITSEMNAFAEELSVGRPRVANARFWEPRVDVIEEEGRFLLKAEIAGVRGDGIQLIYIPDRHSVVIRGVRHEDDRTDGCRQGVHQLEIYYGEFQREIKLPDGVIDNDGIRAQYRNGFLYVLIPKVEQKAMRSITVKKV